MLINTETSDLFYFNKKNIHVMCNIQNIFHGIEIKILIFCMYVTVAFIRGVITSFLKDRIFNI